MAIYISGVKGLPEQVQANKEDIKQIKEDIENIDFDAIRELEAQVDENTNDINNIENGQGVQDHAINGLGARAEALESKTQKITYNEQADELTIDTNTNIKRLVITTPNTPLRADSMVSRDDNNAISLTGANDEISLIVGRNGTQHILNFNADGTLDIDGNPVGGGLHTHLIGIYSTSHSFSAYFTWFSERNTPFTTIEEIAGEIYAKGIVGSDNKSIMANGNNVQGTLFITSAYAYSSTDLRFRYSNQQIVACDGVVDFADVVL